MQFMRQKVEKWEQKEGKEIGSKNEKKSGKY